MSVINVSINDVSIVIASLVPKEEVSLTIESPIEIEVTIVDTSSLLIE